MLFQDKDNSVQVPFITGCHSLTLVLANFPNLSFCSLFYKCYTKYSGLILVSNLGLVAVHTHCEVLFKADVLLCRYSESTNSMYIDTEKYLECSLSVAMNMGFSYKMG